MIRKELKNAIKKDNDYFKKIDPKFFVLPEYDPSSHYIDISKSKYFNALIVLRHYIKLSSDFYFSHIVGAKNVDLFMLTPSISSPMGAGSDSEAIPIKFGKYDSYLVDSSQFGFEPLLLNGLDKVYCYLPSMRGEDPDSRHLNQFYHCEAEIKGDLESLIPVVENYISFLAETILMMPDIYKRISQDPVKTKIFLERIIKHNKFKRFLFSDVIKNLERENSHEYVSRFNSGKDITHRGEKRFLEKESNNSPTWVFNYNRDRNPFYQKPDPENLDTTINADLLFPPIIEDSFCGEIVGSGQRQNNVDEMYESLKRQGVPSESYEWYINLRRQENYQTTSGFGMGIERFISWALGLQNIRDSIIYPRIKNVKTFP